jgi:hypothetical protein
MQPSSFCVPGEPIWSVAEVVTLRSLARSKGSRLESVTAKSRAACEVLLKAEGCKGIGVIVGIAKRWNAAHTGETGG